MSKKKTCRHLARASGLNSMNAYSSELCLFRGEGRVSRPCAFVLSDPSGPASRTAMRCVIARANPSAMEGKRRRPDTPGALSFAETVMGLISFVKNVGASIFGGSEAKAAPVEELKKELEKHGLEFEGREDRSRRRQGEGVGHDVEFGAGGEDRHCARQHRWRPERCRTTSSQPKPRRIRTSIR